VLWTVWWISVSVRVVNSVLVQTFFSPDEYWQSLEPAHVAVFGYGELTWEWRHHIRSFLHPLVYALLFALLDLLSLDQSFLITLAPNLLNALFAALADLSTFRLASLLFGQGPARWAVCHPLLPFSPTPPPPPPPPPLFPPPPPPLPPFPLYLDCLILSSFFFFPAALLLVHLLVQLLLPDTFVFKHHGGCYYHRCPLVLALARPRTGTRLHWQTFGQVRATGRHNNGR